MPETRRPGVSPAGPEVADDLAVFRKRNREEPTPRNPIHASAATGDDAVPPEARRQLAQVHALAQALEQASEPEEIRDIETKLDAIEGIMRKTGLYRIEEIRPINEARMRARWKLGKALAKQLRGAGPGRGKDVHPSNTFFRGLLKRLGILPSTAMLCQRLGTLPAAELNKAFDEARKQERLLSYVELEVVDPNGNKFSACIGEAIVHATFDQ